MCSVAPIHENLDEGVDVILPFLTKIQTTEQD